MALRPIIQRRLEKLERNTDVIFAMVEGLPIDLLSMSPGEGQWNVLQVLNHLYLSERLSLQYVKHKLTKPETIPAWRPDAWLRTILLKWVLDSPLKVKSPPQINMWGDQPVMQLAEINTAWTELRKELVAVLSENEERYRNRLVYKQPFVGRMTLNQMLFFFNDHLLHHTRQVRRIVDKIRENSQPLTAK